MKGVVRGPAARLAQLVPSGSARAARTPFVLLVVVLLGSGLITLLLLNASLNQGSFALSELRKETTELTDEEQALQKEVDAYEAPDALARRARELGMVPGGGPVFLNPDGSVRGVPSAASDELAALGVPKPSGPAAPAAPARAEPAPVGSAPAGSPSAPLFRSASATLARSGSASSAPVGSASTTSSPVPGR